MTPPVRRASPERGSIAMSVPSHRPTPSPLAPDTSGAVVIPHPGKSPRARILAPLDEVVRWSDLSPFEQGYVEAMFASGVRQCERCCGNGELIADEARYLSPLDGDKGDEAVGDCPNCSGRGEFTLGGFSDLAPETLAAIRKDCSAIVALYQPHIEGRIGASAGEGFWLGRQLGHYATDGFPPLTVTLGDDGKVRFSPVADTSAFQPIRDAK